MKKYLIGVDEVGRGPVAGPVAVGVVAYKIEQEKFLLKKKKETRRLPGSRFNLKINYNIFEKWVIIYLY